jgi:hypothetical protein
MTEPVDTSTHATASSDVNPGLSAHMFCGADPKTAPDRLGGTSPSAGLRLLRQLARVSKDDLRLPLVIADLPCHANALAGE